MRETEAKVVVAGRLHRHAGPLPSLVRMVYQYLGHEQRKFSRLPLIRILAPLALIALLALLVSRTDLAALKDAFSQISALHVALGLLLVQVQIIVSAFRWRFTAARLGENIPVPLAIREYYVASFLNQSLPGGVAGDAIRAFRMRHAGEGGWKQPAKAVLLERLSGQMTFFLLALPGLAIWPFVLSGGETWQGVLPFMVGAVGVGAAIGIGVIIAWHRVAWLRSLAKEATDVFIRDRALLIQSSLSFIIVATYVATFLVASDAIGAPLPWTAALTVIPLALIAMLIPVGLGGWGTREVAAMALWPLIGATPTEGLVASLVYGGLSLAGALPGLGLLSLEALRGRPRRA